MTAISEVEAKCREKIAEAEARGGDRERAERLQSEADAAYRELGMKV